MNTIYYHGVKIDEMLPCVATIGFFDGVHRGHQFLIRHLAALAKVEGLQSVVITFDEHPRRVLQSDYQPERLCTLDSKLILLSKTEIDKTVVLHFDRTLATLSAKEFMEQVLRNHLNVKKLFVGYDHRFGHDRKEGFTDYVRYGKELGIEVIQNQAFCLNEVNVSSSVIRSLLKEGEVELANQCLGYPYTVIGKVVNGYHEGRKMGFPTANIDLSDFGQMVPSPGVYAVRVRMEQSVEMKRGMMNIGSRPTFDGQDMSLEVNIFNYEGNLYGKLLLVSFMHKVREERKFSSAEELAQQLQEDKKQVLRLFEQAFEEPQQKQ